MAPGVETLNPSKPSLGKNEVDWVSPANKKDFRLFFKKILLPLVFFL